ncbi:MAG: pyridoxal phosphate-dependent aminotransferase, partial [Syntrophothermus sp.]
AMDYAVELNSLSKSHNMAGWRMGMLAGNKDLINTVLQFKSNLDSGMFLPIQMAAVKALSLTKEWFGSLNDIYKKRREKVFELVELLNCTYEENQGGMFVWAKLNNGDDCYSFTDKILNKADVFITPGGIFGSAGNNYIRISLCASENIFQEAINKIKKSL